MWSGAAAFALARREDLSGAGASDTLRITIVVSAYTSPRQGDPMRLGVAMVAITILGGSLRWLLAPGSESFLAVVFVLVCGTGCFVLRLMRAYGRGPNVR